MDPIAITAVVTAIAASISQSAEPEELPLLAAIFTQLGDTLATITVQKAFLENKK